MNSAAASSNAIPAQASPARFCSPHPRRNLPGITSSKRGESNFVGAFYRKFEEARSQKGLGGTEFALPNFGIADLVWVCQLSGAARNRATFAASLKDVHITAFEMKLGDWRKALSQAYRYKYFADRVIVVLPPGKAKLAKEAIALFRDLEIGLWSFEGRTGKISRSFTPPLRAPKSAVARGRALELLRRKLHFR